jgi:predicted dehydrogenase
VQLVGVTSGNPENAKEFAHKHDIQQAYMNFADMLDKAELDVVSLCVPNSLHGPFAIEAAEKGVKVVVVEKPVTIWPGYAEGKEASAERKKVETMQYVDEILDTFDRTGSKLLYAENFVYMPGVLSAIQTFREGGGHIIDIEGECSHWGSHATYYDKIQLSGGGALISKTVHPLGAALYTKYCEGIFRNQEPIRPEAVFAVTSQIMKAMPQKAQENFVVMQNVEDWSLLMVKFSDGAMAQLKGTDTYLAGIKNTVEIRATNEIYRIDINPNNHTTCFSLSPETLKGLELREKQRHNAGWSNPSIEEYRLNGYVNELMDAVKCALDEPRMPQSGALLARDTMAIVGAAYESVETGSWVDIADIVNARKFAKKYYPNFAYVEPIFRTRG